MTTESPRLLVLRDGDGSYYLISDDLIRSSRVPEEHWTEVQAALDSDVAGFFFNNQAFQTAFTNVNQGNSANNTNVLLGALVGGSQTALSFQSNAANVGTVQNA